ncbi:MAG: ATP-binding protein [Terracidiphilus sp.]
MCDACGGLGLIRTQAGGRWVSRACECQAALEIAARLKRARIPAAFADCTLENFKVSPHTKRGLAAARKFVEEFVPGQRDLPGLLLTGTVGVGKTHLAAAVLRRLIEAKGIEGRWATVPELLDRLRSSYDPEARESQAQILGPIMRADLVVIDELGSSRPSDWVFETVELLIGSLYNSARTVLVTSNLPNLAAGASAAAGTPQNEFARAARAETLGDRIGARMWSRLQQMCAAVDMSGPDWRAR